VTHTNILISYVTILLYSFAAEQASSKLNAWDITLLP
jgi:hypothetical protein